MYTFATIFSPRSVYSTAWMLTWPGTFSVIGYLKLKADMMNRPDRWAPVTVEQVRAKCRELGMRADDVDTITSYVQRRKDGRRFNVGSSYRTFQFR